MVELEAAGYSSSPRRRGAADRAAAEPRHHLLDPPLGVHVTTEADARQVREPGTPSPDHPIDIPGWMPERPYFSAEVLRKWGLPREVREPSARWPRSTRGSSRGLLAHPDVVNNQRVTTSSSGSTPPAPIAAICYGVAALVFARDFNERVPIIRGKHVTGHCIEYDYHDCTGFVGTDLNMGRPVCARVSCATRWDRRASTTATSASRPR
jgi:hypothetical protein